jgi:1-deoxy-D-xylulose-5-phosphate reductoisomerase
MKKKRIVLLGASGSVGMQTIDVVLQHPDRYQIVAIAVGENLRVLKLILKKISVKLVSVELEKDAAEMQKQYPDLRFVWGEKGLNELAAMKNYDLLFNALVGFVGFGPTLTAIETHHDVALANKETLVVGGEFIKRALARNRVHLYPVDSEHSAIYQCLRGSRHKDVLRLLITASGGSFRGYSREQLKNVTVRQALTHPNWKMGPKITIDSATMMNKGFEVIEAHWLFNVDYDHIDVLMHDESVVHSMVEYNDHSIVALLGCLSMRSPIQYALSCPEHLPMEQLKQLDLAALHTLHFSSPDVRRFPLLGLAYQAGKKGGNIPAIMNAANEVANLAFRNGLISFLEIENIVINTVLHADYRKLSTLQELYDADAWGHAYAEALVKKAAAVQ